MKSPSEICHVYLHGGIQTNQSEEFLSQRVVEQLGPSDLLSLRTRTEERCTLCLYVCVCYFYSFLCIGSSCSVSSRRIRYYTKPANESTANASIVTMLACSFIWCVQFPVPAFGLASPFVGRLFVLSVGLVSFARELDYLSSDLTSCSHFSRPRSKRLDVTGSSHAGRANPIHFCLSVAVLTQLID